jgi:hypothetical protein
MQRTLNDLQSILPPLYAGWMSELLDGPIPAETEATCQDCVMCSRNGRNKSEIVFNPDTKCCTYMPQLPNFVVGSILTDQDPDSQRGKTVLESLLKQGCKVTPLGLDPPQWYSALYRENQHKFGIDAELRCPFYVDEANGSCSIWKNRNSHCVTFFCKFKRGSLGVIFWKYVDQLLSGIEKELARWCVLQLDPGETTMEELFPPPMCEIDLSNPSRLWGKWWMKEKQFFQESSDLVNRLTWMNVSEICGTAIHIAAHLTQISYRRMISDDIPQYLKVASWKKVKLVAPDLYRIWSYNRYDPFDLHKEVLEALPFFDGKSTAEETVQSIEQKNRVVIDHEMLRQLSDRGILETSENPE